MPLLVNSVGGLVCLHAPGHFVRFLGVLRQVLDNHQVQKFDHRESQAIRDFPQLKVDPRWHL